MKLNLKEVKYIIKESACRLLLEISNDAIETIIKRAYPSLNKDVLNMPIEKARKLAVCDWITAEDVAKSPNMALKDFYRLNIMREFHINRNAGPYEYLRGIIRICCSPEIDMYNPNRTEEQRKNYIVFRRIVDYIYSNKIKADSDLNGLSFSELKQAYHTIIRKQDFRAWVTNRNDVDENEEFNSYTIKRIPTHAAASKYKQYTDWCVTQQQVQFDGYTRDGSVFYFCLQKGFESVPMKIGQNCPLDEYGLSMIALCVKPNGEAKHITTRWNHENNGEDNPQLRTIEQLEALVGVPKGTFYNYKARPDLENEDIEELLSDDTVPVDKIFNNVIDVVHNPDLKIVEFNGKFALLNGRQIVGNVWYDNITEPKGGCFVAKNGDEETFINDEAQPIFNKFWANAIYFNGTWGCVLDKSVYGPASLINAQGDVVESPFENWDIVRAVDNKLLLTRNERYKIVDINGNLQAPNASFKIQPYGEPESETIRTAKGEMFRLNTYTLELSDIDLWEKIEAFYEYEEEFPVEDDTCLVEIYHNDNTDKWAVVKVCGQNGDGRRIVLCDEAEEVEITNADSLLFITKGDSYSYVPYGRVPDELNWYDEIIVLDMDNSHSHEFLLALNTGDKYNIVNVQNEDILNGEQLDWIDFDCNEYYGYKVMKNGKMNVINPEHNILFSEWVDDINFDITVSSEIFGYLVVVKKDNLYNLYTIEGEPVSPEWFEKIKEGSDYYNVKVKYKGKPYIFDIDEGVLMNPKTDEEIQIIDYDS